MTVIVSEKGQVTIPKELRDKLGLKAGVVLDFEVRDGVLLGRKKLLQDPFSKWRGRGELPVGKSVDDYLSMIRDDHRR